MYSGKGRASPGGNFPTPFFRVSSTELEGAHRAKKKKVLYIVTVSITLFIFLPADAFFTSAATFAVYAVPFPTDLISLLYFILFYFIFPFLFAPCLCLFTPNGAQLYIYILDLVLDSHSFEKKKKKNS